MQQYFATSLCISSSSININYLLECFFAHDSSLQTNEHTSSKVHTAVAVTSLTVQAYHSNIHFLLVRDINLEYVNTHHNIGARFPYIFHSPKQEFIESKCVPSCSRLNDCKLYLHGVRRKLLTSHRISRDFHITEMFDGKKSFIKRRFCFK